MTSPVGRSSTGGPMANPDSRESTNAEAGPVVAPTGAATDLGRAGDGGSHTPEHSDIRRAGQSDREADVQPCGCGRIIGPTEHHCWWHHADENPEGAFIVCGECFHVYRTAADLEAACREVNGGRHVPAAEIDSCPECIHDF